MSEFITWEMVDLGDGNVVPVVGDSSSNCPTKIYLLYNLDVGQLSQHGQTIAKLGIATAEVFNATADYSTELDGVLLLPSSRKP